jgi:hypothetical protein
MISVDILEIVLLEENPLLTARRVVDGRYSSASITSMSLFTAFRR